MLLSRHGRELHFLLSMRVLLLSEGAPRRTASSAQHRARTQLTYGNGWAPPWGHFKAKAIQTVHLKRDRNTFCVQGTCRPELVLFSLEPGHRWRQYWGKKCRTNNIQTFHLVQLSPWNWGTKTMLFQPSQGTRIKDGSCSTQLPEPRVTWMVPSKRLLKSLTVGRFCPSNAACEDALMGWFKQAESMQD